MISAPAAWSSNSPPTPPGAIFRHVSLHCWLLRSVCEAAWVVTAHCAESLPLHMRPLIVQAVGLLPMLAYGFEDYRALSLEADSMVEVRIVMFW